MIAVSGLLQSALIHYFDTDTRCHHLCFYLFCFMSQASIPVGHKLLGKPSLPPLIRTLVSVLKACSRNCQAPSEAGLLQLWAVFMWLPAPPGSSSQPRIASSLGEDLCHPLPIHPLFIILLNKGVKQPK